MTPPDQFGSGDQLASASILQLDTVPRHVCVAAGGDAIMDQEGLDEISVILRAWSAPRAVGSVYREVARLLQFKRKDQTMDQHLAQFALLRRKTESKTHMSEDLPVTFATALCMQNASLFRSGKWLVLASVQGDPSIAAVARRMRRCSTACFGGSEHGRDLY